MACNYPVRAYRVKSKFGVEVKFQALKGDNVVQDLMLPCGQCLGCKLERSRQWAIRCMNEASMYEQNCFITLTFNEDNLPDGNSLTYEPFQLFMKRLRKRFSNKKIRFYMCGEYGENNERPHYHACLFNHNFDDRKFYKDTASGSRLYTSDVLDEVWQKKGWATVGDVTFESAAYVARYIMKKVNGRGNNMTYADLDKETGEVYYREKEFNKMSLKPGIGKGWYDLWKRDVFPNDICIVNGKEVKPPKYYALKYKEENPEGFEELQYRRSLRAIKKAADNTDERLLVKEKVLAAKISLLKREIK